MGGGRRGDELRLADVVGRAFAEWDGVEHREAHGNLQAADLRADRLDDPPHEPRPVLERSPVRSAARPRAEQLVSQIAVARFDVDEAEAGAPRQPRRRDEILHERVELRVAEYADATREPA